MKSTLLFLLVCLWMGFISSCGSTKPYYQNGNDGLPVSNTHPSPTEVEYSLFLVGGVSFQDSNTVLNAIQSAANKKDGLILLGDNLSLGDLPSSSVDELTMENGIYSKLKQMSSSFHDFYLIPGEKEWSGDKKTSVAAMSSLDKLLKDVKEKGRLLVPAKDCGMPEVVRLSSNLIVVLMDSQWAIETASHPGDNIPGCELDNVLELRNAIKDIIQSHPSDFIVLASHHPLYANGPTAGNYSLGSHFIPLPVVGTLINGIKNLVGSNQYFGHPAYEAYRSAFLTAIDGCQNCIVVSGHEQSLQYFQEQHQDFLVVGSGEQVTHARKGGSAGFSYMSKGYVRADVLSGGKLQLSFYSVDDDRHSILVWQKTLTASRKQISNTDIANDKQYANQDSILLPASTRYSKQHVFRGEFYRSAWSTPVKLQVLHLDQVHGGLVPKQLGGGNQTRSLRLENASGEQYVLRSIDKKVTAVLPVALRGSFAESIVQEGIAASHPYGALVIPKLAASSEVFYTNPSVVYVPHQAALGIYDEEIGDGVYIFEERPGGNTASFSNFGNTKKTYNTTDVIEMIAESHQYKIDQRAVLRARLLDIWLGDWDRHDDQWRWASFEEGETTILKPIPRDRDQVFYKNDGILDYLASRPYFNPPLRKFTSKIDHLDGLIWAGKYFDRSFLHELTENDFIAIADSLQKELSDQIIETAFQDWPAKIDSLDGERIRSFLKIRRDDLELYAKDYYALLSKEVFIPATTDKDHILINAPEDGQLEVMIKRLEKDSSYLYYQRLFNDKVTKELRIFGLNKQDSLHLLGNGSVATKIRFIGGSGRDILSNASSHLHVKAYDSDDGMSISGNHIKKHFNDQPFNNTYDRTDWNLNRHFQFISPTFYTDEGVGLNYTYWLTRYGFRSNPYKSRHSLGLSYFFGTNAYIGKYKGDWMHALGLFDLGLNIFLSGPAFTQYFYGLGNAYIDSGNDRNFHIVSGRQINFFPSISRRFGFGSSITLTPSFQFINIEDEEEDPRFIYTPASGLSPDDFGARQYLGLFATYRYSRVNNSSFPTRGGEMDITTGGRTSVSGENIHHAYLGIKGSLYLPFDVAEKWVLATHFSGDIIFGEYEFFHALTLGGPARLRGYRTDRFAGESRFFQSTDLRFKLFHQKGVLPFQLGVYASFDYGRVWYDEDPVTAEVWHTAYGGGLFIVPFGLTAFRIGYMTGDDDQQVTIGGALKF